MRPSIIASRRGVCRRPMLLMWTMWTEAPVAATLASTSCSASMLPPGSTSPADRMWMNASALRRAASSKTRRSSSRPAPGV